MFDLVLYYSKSGSSLEVAKYFNLPFENVLNKPNLEKNKNIVIVCPTYGDEELPSEMEDYLLNLKYKNKNYAICELGNFFGFESSFGIIKVIKHQLFLLDWNFVDSISIDSVPEIDWGTLEKWKEKLLNK